jgi:long-chain acyl-CoA synthetase
MEHKSLTGRVAPTLMEITGRRPLEPALGDQRRTLTWRELEARTNALGHRIEHDLGVTPGSNVAVIATNRYEFIEALIGAMRAGMVVVPVKASWTAEEIGYLLEDADARLVITDLDSGRQAATLRATPVLDLGSAAAPHSFEGWLARQSDRPLPYERNGWRMAYTSGTTGKPKGVVRRFRGDRPWCEAFASSTWLNDAMHLDPSGPHLNVSALYHGAPLGSMLALLAAGAECRILGRWDPESALTELQRDVRSTVMVPTHFRQLLALPEPVRLSFDAPELRSVVHGGEPCPQSVKRAMIEWFGPIVHEYYGTSEGGTTTVTADEWLERPGTVGRPVAGMEVHVLDDQHHERGPNKEGTIYFRHQAGQFFSYRNSPEKTASAHTADGSFTVGDIGYLDEDGFLFISGRKADVIVSSGVNIYPAEIEDCLFSLPQVAEVAVVGGPDDQRGERPVAFVRLAEGCTVESALPSITTAAEQRLAGYKRPREWRVRQELPRDGTGKLLRHVLRAELWEGREDVFANTGRPSP